MVHVQDIVETHLLRDIAARSENFFQAASVVQDLRGVLARTYTQVKGLRQQVSCSSAFLGRVAPSLAPVLWPQSAWP